MGSAPVRHDADTMLESTLRRGAHVGPGMPGVLQVRHAGGSGGDVPATLVGPWIQPDDVDYSQDYGANPVATLAQQTHTTDSQPGQDPFPYTVRLDGLPHTNADIGVAEWHIAWSGPVDSLSSASFTLLINPQALFDPDPPAMVDWPAGAVGIEYETDIGWGPGVVAPDDQTLATHATMVAGPDNSTFSGGKVIRVPVLDVPAATVVIQPSFFAGMTLLETLGSGAAPVEQDLVLTGPPLCGFAFLDAEQLALDLGGPVTYPTAIGAAITLSGFVISGTYTPSRYRFTF